MSDATENMNQQKINAIEHIVHEYANFVSSAKMVVTGEDSKGDPLKPPVNTHVAHAFYLNCRKLADFFQGRKDDKKRKNDKKREDNVLAKHFVDGGFSAALPVYAKCKGLLNKQLAHLTYTRVKNSREITSEVQKALIDELTKTWREFRGLLRDPYDKEFTKQVQLRKSPSPDGKPSEFRSCDLD